MSHNSISPKHDEKDNQKQTRVDLLYHLLNTGIAVYFNESIESEMFTNTLLKWMQQHLKLDAELSKGESLHTIEYKYKGGITGTLGLTAGFKLFYIIDNNKLFFDIKDEKWFENPDSKFSISKLVSDSYQAEIQKYIFDYALSHVPGAEEPLKIDERNHFIEKISIQKKIWFVNYSDKDEKLLVLMPFSAIKTNDGSLNDNKDLNWYFILSSKKSLIAAFDKRELEVQTISCEDAPIKVKKELGRDPVEFKGLSFFSTRSNDDLFYQVQHLNLLKPDEKVREIARLNWIYKKKNEASNQLAMELMSELINQLQNPFDELSLLYMGYSEGDREKVFSTYTEDNKLIGLLHQLLNYAGTNEFLTKWIQNWEISYIDSVAVNDLLVKAIEDAVQANNILPFHRMVRENFLKLTTDDINPFLFDITFCQHLIKCGLGNEARKILLKRLEQLPDESIMDLLPGKDVDLTGPAAGQIIKVSILEILAGLETEKKAINHKCQIARLQPLVETRIDKLIEVSEPQIASKAKEIKSIMQPGGLKNIMASKKKFVYKQLDAKLLEKHIQHPASRKGGSFSNFQKWIASVKVPDYSMLKSYSEKLSPQKHEVLNEIIADIKYALNIEKLEVYISRGEKSVGINGFESDPLFLIIGGDHLEKDSPHYLKPLELRFAVGVELAHLHFKHARITSNDVWKGAWEKGYFVIDSVLSIFPALGLFSKSLQSIGKLNQISSFLQRTSKVGKVSGQSREILKTSEQVVNIYKSKFSKDQKELDKENELMATFRIMQLTAERCALIFTKDLGAAIRAMFLVSRRYYGEIPVIEKYGLKEFLLKKNDDGSFRHQELAIRLASLFSFYLSDDYENMVKKLEA